MSTVLLEGKCCAHSEIKEERDLDSRLVLAAGGAGLDDRAHDGLGVQSRSLTAREVSHEMLRSPREVKAPT